MPLFSINLMAQETETKPYFYQDSIKVQDIEAFTYIAHERKGSYSQMNAAYTTLWEESVKQFLAYDEHGFFSVYHNSPSNTKEEDLKWEVGSKLIEDEGDEILNPLKKKKWDFKKVVTIKYDGPIGEEMGQAYEGIMKYISENGYQVVGPSLERHLKRPQMKDGVLIGSVKIWMPIEALK